ncbi:hypothetical protein [Candidatus Chlorohelix sp.]|uniref:hypothetical protein n=1 Tax=Candidatus Chlorohelix sp. TaxID=3139201 RepID=UPI0030570C73
MKSVVEINRIPEEVFEYLSNGNKTNEYFIRDFEVKPLVRPPSTDGIYRLGTYVRGKGAFFGKKVSILYKVVVFTPGQEVRLRSEDKEYDSEVIWLLHKTADGNTRVSLELKLVMRTAFIGFFANTAIQMLDPVLTGYLQHSLSRLKHILEGKPGEHHMQPSIS